MSHREGTQQHQQAARRCPSARHCSRHCSGLRCLAPQWRSWEGPSSTPSGLPGETSPDHCDAFHSSSPPTGPYTGHSDKGLVCHATLGRVRGFWLFSAIIARYCTSRVAGRLPRSLVAARASLRTSRPRASAKHLGSRWPPTTTRAASPQQRTNEPRNE